MHTWHCTHVRTHEYTEFTYMYTCVHVYMYIYMCLCRQYNKGRGMVFVCICMFTIYTCTCTPIHKRVIECQLNATGFHPNPMTSGRFTSGLYHDRKPFSSEKKAKSHCPFTAFSNAIWKWPIVHLLSSPPPWNTPTYIYHGHTHVAHL